MPPIVSTLKNEEEQRDSGIQMTSVPEPPPALSSPTTQETTSVEYANPSYPESKLVPDTHSVEEHRKLDDEAVRVFPWRQDVDDDFRDTIRIGLLQLLGQDYDRLNHYMVESYEYARSLLHRYPWLSSLIEQCWRERSFQTIRRLREFL